MMGDFSFMAFVTLLDTELLWWLHGLTHCAALDALMPLVSALGNGGVVWIFFCVLLLCNKKTRPTGVAMAAAMLLCVLGGNLLLKNLVARPRPYTVDPGIVLLIPPSNEIYSFPSGHTMNAFSAAGVLLLRRVPYSWAAMGLAVCIAFSRIYLMMHYPLDVAAGALIGLLSAALCVWLLRRWEGARRFGCTGGDPPAALRKKA